jgi:transketolase
MSYPQTNSTVVVDMPRLIRQARQARATCVQLAHDGRVGHVGSALSCVDAIVALYGGWLNVNESNRGADDRDRFILSKGHACTALYAVLAQRGFIPAQWLADYACYGKPLSDHPCKHALELLEMSSGSLGYGLGVAAGMLYGLSLRSVYPRAVVLMSDGECNEGSVWEAAMFAAAKQLGNLVALVDYNGIQAVGRSDEIMGHTSIEQKFRAFGWAARTINGNDMPEVVDALWSLPLEPDKPSAIVLKTLKGAGVSFMQDKTLWHYRVPSDEDLQNALDELGEVPWHLARRACA